MNLAPNGKPSNLTAEQYSLVRTSAFKKWFGDWENYPETASKVIDENGEPFVLHRGNLVNQDFKKKLPKSATYSDKVIKAVYYTLQQNKDTQFKEGDGNNPDIRYKKGGITNKFIYTIGGL